ncbi:9181_t:CDS:2, partial [Funneliformis geosporum]
MIGTETDLDFFQAFSLFTDNLALINQLVSTPGPEAYESLHKQNSNYHDTGQAIIDDCYNVFFNSIAAKTLHKQSTFLNNIVQNFRNSLQVFRDITPKYLSPVGASVNSGAPITPPETFRDLSSLLETPKRDHLRKWSLNKNLAEDIGVDLARELLTVRDINLEVWTPMLENYNNTVLGGNDGIFKAQDKVSDAGDNIFQLY